MDVNVINVHAAIQRLEQEWEQVEAKGFFGSLKFGMFDPEGFRRVQVILQAIEIPEGETLEKRFVEVTWFIPTFMRWQQDGWRADGKDTRELDEAISFVE